MQVYGKRPFLTEAAHGAIGRVRGLDVPLALHARATSGSYGVARAVHREGRAGGFVSVRVPLLPDRALGPKLRAELDADPGLDRLTLYVDDLERQRREVQEELLDLIDEGMRDRGRSVPVRLIARIGEETRLAVADLTRRLSVVAVRLPPLAERTDELAAIVAALAEDLAVRLGLPSRWVAPEAVRVLAERPWPGDVDDLEVVLSRLLIGARGSVVTIEDVWEIDAPGPARSVDPARRPASPRADGESVPASHRSRPSAERELELVVTELAHELKNPMVTLKTFTQHLDRLLEDAETRERFVGLAGEAIERMDGFLEEMLAFSRFREPRAQVLPLEPIVSGAISVLNGTARRVSGDGIPAGAVVVADEEQAAFALRALVRAFHRRLPPEAPILYQWLPPGGLRFDARTESAGVALHNVVDSEVRDELSASVEFFMARSLVERNRGTLEADRDDSGLHVRLQLPSAGAR